MPETEQSADRSIDRRTILAGIGAATSAGLAGCQTGGNDGDDGNDGNDNGNNGSGTAELGERVPKVNIEYWSSSGVYTAFQEAALPVIKDNVSELGITLEPKPVELTSALQTLINDTRSANLHMYGLGSTPENLDPDPWTVRFGADYAGGNGRPSPNQYTDCQYTTAVNQQSKAADEEERQQLINDALGRMSEDVGVISLMPLATVAGYRTDELELDGLGERLLNFLNMPSMAKTEATNDSNSIVFPTGPSVFQTTNYLVHNSILVMAVWNHGVNSPLLEYDGEYNLVNSLAEDYTISDDATEITVTLSDATFHNGDPVTAEDVKFTYEHISGNPGTIPKATTAPFESITAEGEKTVRFTFSEPYVPFLTTDMPSWGILHKESWVEAGAREEPGGVQFDDIVGSGPFQVENFAQGQSLSLTPHDGHPVWTPKSNVVLKAYRDSTTTFQAFKTGEVNLASLSPSRADQVESDSSVTIKEGQPFMNGFIGPQVNFGPAKFLAFRKAIGAAINREKINQIAFLGRGDPDLYSAPCHKSHPWRPPDDELYKMADTLQGDTEAAKEHLREAGWGWDDNGNLHYPPDADLSPQWPKGETPDYSNFPCVNDDGEYIPKEQR